ncbi:MAG: hypothetical protein ACE5EB_01520 [Thermodesulfobacteriota bacterium]
MKTLFFILIAYLLYVIIKRLFASNMPARPARPAGDETVHETHVAGGEEMVQDPVCESYVPFSAALKARTKKGEFYFCSSECRDKFISEMDE